MANPKVKSFLLNTLPDTAKEMTDEIVEGVEYEMLREWVPEFEEAFGLKRLPIYDRRMLGAASVPGYIVRATHTRFGRGKHSFIGEVPMARVSLPTEHSEGAGSILETKVGDVINGDHRLYSVPMVRDYYRDYLTFAPSRVDLITPLRLHGHRFAAVAIYLMYGEAGSVDAFAFEAGMATGKPMVLYASKDMSPIVRRAGYKPTPFASIDHWYLGSLQMDGEDPKSFTVEVYGDPAGVRSVSPVAVEGAPEFRLSATLEKTDALPLVTPFALTLQAALRVCAIAEARGEQVPGLGVITNLLAPLGRKFGWIEEPTS